MQFVDADSGGSFFDVRDREWVHYPILATRREKKERDGIGVCDSGAVSRRRCIDFVLTLLRIRADFRHGGGRFRSCIL